MNCIRHRINSIKDLNKINKLDDLLSEYTKHYKGVISHP